MTTNFFFLQQEFASLKYHAEEAEQHVYTKPMYSAFVCRKSLEEMVRWIYDNDQDVELPYDTSLNSLMHEQSFKNVVPDAYWKNINLLRKIGNNAVHTGEKTTPKTALAAVKYLFDFAGWMVRMYSRNLTPSVVFNEDFISKDRGADVPKEEIRKLEARYEASLQALERANEEIIRSKEQYAALQRRLKAVHIIKEERKQKPLPLSLSISERETRLLYIDELLRESGWDPQGANVVEYPVTGMPNSNGNGYVDYVLWGDDGKPLALVEAKKTLMDPHAGQHQAELYADCLEKAFGQRPIIFYTNGFDTYIWDDTFYPARRVYGFYTKSELELLINRRHTRKSLTGQPVNKEIAGRYYQEMAITRVSEAFENKSRAVLLVMATGSGKTRTAAALVDILTKASWAKKVLFLADRNALVTQAKNNFNKYLPHLTAIDLTKEEEDISSRLVFSTYPTMMNRIDVAKEEGKRYYGPGHFDVVIIDEAHRRVYQKYKAIFEYFDALLIGLTATPKAEADKDTYSLFGLKPHNPTFAYELEAAVRDGYLVPPKAWPIKLKFPRHGIRYDELSDEDKAEYEKEFLAATGAVPDSVTSGAVNDWLFNKSTIHKVLDVLMDRGVKIEGGDKIGKSIIFARNHDHALEIQRLFNIRYPKGAGKVLRIIDNYETYAQDMLNLFSEPEKLPQIAVSVDMLDTGIDIPEIVNLVIFKPVRSKAKFWQMIGRGTRLSPDLFGPGMNKEYFHVFDVCGNIEFFSAEMGKAEARSHGSLSQQIFNSKLNVAYLLSRNTSTENVVFQKKLLDELHGYVCAMDPSSDFRVKMQHRFVEKYKIREKWDGMEQLDILEIENHIAPLYRDDASDEDARRFDLVMLKLQLSMLEGSTKTTFYKEAVQSLASQLLNKMTIPAVKQQEDLINAMAGDVYWQAVEASELHDHRLALRELIKYIEKRSKPRIYTDFKDEFTANIKEEGFSLGGTNLEPYRRQIEKFIREHEHHITIHRIKYNQPITQSELDEVEKLLLSMDTSISIEVLQRTLEGQPLGQFIRSIIGLDINAAKEAFSDFLTTVSLNADQQAFINKLVDFLTVKGIIDPEMLFQMPFTEINDEGITGLFSEGQTATVISIINGIKDNAAKAG